MSCVKEILIGRKQKDRCVFKKAGNTTKDKKLSWSHCYTLGSGTFGLILVKVSAG